MASVTLWAALVGLAGCRPPEDPWGKTNKLRVVASFPPLYCFVQNVAGPDAEVRCLIDTEGPHGYQYDPREVRLLRTADVFFANGLTLDDHFTHNLRNSSGNPNLRFVEVGTCIDAGRLLAMKEDEGHSHAGHHHHHHGPNDPHVWLGIPEAIEMVRCIANVLAEKDPAHASGYRQRADAYIERLQKLYAQGREKLAGKNIKLVTVHESLGYFARAFDLQIAGSIQLHPGDEPTGAHIRDLAQLCVKEQVRIIAVEPQYPENTARTLLSVLKDKGVPNPVLVTIDPLETVAGGVEGEGFDAGWYERKMAENIDNLAKAVP
ncbi:MAG TPA: metal ABC transporter substrate-binding protein [Gemmataceae bacterium]|nr:metal ABC transporter substrate-binding protein [Gemmataceae bacterium]